MKRVSGGILADGFASFLAGIFNSFPNSIFAQNNGIIQLTGVASRYIRYYIAAFLVILGLFPVVVFSLMPDMLSNMSESIKGIFSSGITTGGSAAIISNVFIRVKEE